MELKSQKRLAAQILKCSPKRIWIDPTNLSDIKEAITKADIRGLIGKGFIRKSQKKGISRGRAKKRQQQRKKGRQRGFGSRKGKKTARTPKKEAWMNKIRSQREFLRELKSKEIVSTQVSTELYKKAKGGFFRSIRHIKLYIDEHRLGAKK